jgi:hypothetical protein
LRRPDALRKRSTLCERLDAIDPNDFFVIPTHLYVFGSLLTDKPNPNDVDLLLKYSVHPDRMNEEIYAICENKPLLIDRAIRYLRRGLRGMRIEPMGSDENLRSWFGEHLFEPNTRTQLAWRPRRDWRRVLERVHRHPNKWDAKRSRRDKAFQAQVKVMIEKTGTVEATKWAKARIRRRNRNRRQS